MTPAASTLVKGKRSIRIRSEHTSFWLTLGSLGITVPLLGAVLGHTFAPNQIALILIGGMLFVTIARGRLLGSSIRVHPRQFGETYEIIADCARALALPTPEIYVRDDYVTPIVAVGIGDPYSIVISSQWIDHLSPGELRFLAGRELGHIRAGHTRLTSLLSVNGRENPIVSIAFGAWLRRIEYTADRAGLLCCGSLATAIAAIAVSSFHSLGRKIDVREFIEQHRAIEREPMLRAGEWISATPYGTSRIAALESFAQSELYAYWQPLVAAGLADDADLGAGARDRIYAGFGRRVAALVIDSMLVATLLPGTAIRATMDKTVFNDPDVPAAVKHVLFALTGTGGVDQSGLSGFVLFLYAIVLVAVSGQTFGMFVLGLRVVTAENTRVGLGGALKRYVLAIGSMLLIYPIFRIFGHVQPYEKFSGTRLLARANLGPAAGTT